MNIYQQTTTFVTGIFKISVVLLFYIVKFYWKSNRKASKLYNITPSIMHWLKYYPKLFRYFEIALTFKKYSYDKDNAVFIFVKQFGNHSDFRGFSSFIQWFFHQVSRCCGNPSCQSLIIFSHIYNSTSNLCNIVSYSVSGFFYKFPSWTTFLRSTTRNRLTQLTMAYCY